MAKPEWGVKRACLSCGGRFYDLRKSPIVCPKCDATFEPEATLRARRVQRSAQDRKPKVVPVVEVAPPEPAAPPEDGTDALVATVLPGEDDDTVVEGDSDDDPVIEDTSVLGDDEDDVPVVVSDDGDEKSQ